MAIMDLPLRAAMPSDLTYLVAIDAQSPGGGWNLASFARELELAWSNVVVVEGEIEGKEAPAVVGFVPRPTGFDQQTGAETVRRHQRFVRPTAQSTCARRP